MLNVQILGIYRIPHLGREPCMLESCLLVIPTFIIFSDVVLLYFLCTACVCAYVCAWMRRSEVNIGFRAQWLAIDGSPSYFLRQDLSFNLEFTNMARLAIQMNSTITPVSLCRSQVIGTLLYLF